MIGIFDSGCGGLTVLRALRAELPSCDVLYFGDTKNAPYGEKTQEELSRLTVRAIERLRFRGATKLMSACNSTSASLAMSLFDVFDIAPAHMIEMVGPTVAAFKGSDAKILLCATHATVRSGLYQNAFKMIGKDIEAVALPELAGAIEAGKPQEELRTIIQSGLSNVQLGQFDALVLACTHYPLVRDLFVECVPPSVQVVDPAVAVARRAYANFWPQEVGDGTTTFLLSQASGSFESFAAELFPGESYSVEVVE